MRVLVACIPSPGCAFLEEWKAHLARSCEVIHDHEEFWSGNGRFDIVHLHWPEYTSFEIEKGLDHGLTDVQINTFRSRLQHWRNTGSSIVIHRHNIFPHAYKDPRFQKLYELAYSHADAVVHMGETSRQDYLSRYGQHFDCARQIQALIPHACFSSYVNTLSKTQARRKLRIRESSQVVLCFGSLSPIEAELLIQAFASLRSWNKALLAPRWKETPHKIRWIRLKNWVRDSVRLYYRLHPWFYFGYDFVDPSRVQYFVNAADVLYVQRWQPLNSGNLILGMTFGKVVVGPDAGNVGEILRATGNPVYEPANAQSAGAALAQGLRLAKEGLGDQNRRLALSEWDPMLLARQHVALYRRLVAQRTTLVETPF